MVNGDYLNFTGKLRQVVHILFRDKHLFYPRVLSAVDFRVQAAYRFYLAPQGDFAGNSDVLRDREPPHCTDYGSQDRHACRGTVDVSAAYYIDMHIIII